MQHNTLASALILACLSFFISQGDGMTKNESPTIGAVKWVIVETATGKTISSGGKTLRVSDIEILTKGDLYEKQIALPEKFYFSLCDNATRDKEPNDGFGLAGGRYGENDFSWDWFQVD